MKVNSAKAYNKNLKGNFFLDKSVFPNTTYLNLRKKESQGDLLQVNNFQKEAIQTQKDKDGEVKLPTLTPSEEPPNDGKCHVFIGGRTIDHWSGYIGFRHLYILYYKNSMDYGVIEAGPVPSNASMGGGHSGAWVKPNSWESRGIQWEITPKKCAAIIDCLKQRTAVYNNSKHPYHATEGPNSNSFVKWVMKQCGINISFLVSSYPYLGVDYWDNIRAKKAKEKRDVPTPSH